MKLKLLKDEKILAEIKPHYMAFYDLYLIWAWTITLAIVFAVAGDQLAALTGNPLTPLTGYMEWMTAPHDNQLIQKVDFFQPILGEMNGITNPVNKYMTDYAGIGLWLTALMLSSIPVSFIRIEFKWGFVMAAVGAGSVLATALAGVEPKYAYYVSIILSLGGMYLVDIYRQSHRFLITNRRIVTEAKLITHSSNELSYDKINNIVLERDLVGTIFGFGTVIPVTASGLGMGADMAAITVGIAGSPSEGTTLAGGLTAGRSIQVPRTRSMYALFGVQNPESVKELISEQMHEYVQAPYLRKMTEQLEGIGKAVGKGPEEKTRAEP